jgi:hypothetical protein
MPNARWPAGTRPASTSYCDGIAFSQLAKRMSLPSASSLPTPVARPLIEAMDATGARHRQGDLYYRLLLPRTLADYKEADRFPAEIRTRHGTIQRTSLL